MAGPARLGWALVTSFLSGAGILVVELCATRSLAPFFGQSMAVWTNVIGMVLLGLALGSALGGRVADRCKGPLLLAGLLGVAALLVALAPLMVPRVSRWLLPAELPLEAAPEFLAKGSLVVTFLCFVPPVLLLGAVAPFLVRFHAASSQVGSRSGLLFAASSVGSIVGTFATYHWLLPGLGIKGCCWFAAGLLALAGVPLIERRAGPISISLLMAGGALLGLGLTGSTPAHGAAWGDPLFAADSAYQHVEVRWRKDLDAKVLAIDEGHDSFQSILPREGRLTGAYYDYFALLPFLESSASKVPSGPRRCRVLILGFAGGTHARILLQAIDEWNWTAGKARIDLELVGIEIDPTVIEAARRHLDLPEDRRLKIHAGIDARVFVGVDRSRYDLVIVDCYSQQSFIPEHLASAEFFAELRPRLNPAAVVAVNAYGFGAQDPLVRSLAATIETVFRGTTVCVALPDTPNFLIYAGVSEPPELLHRLPPEQTPALLHEPLEQLARNPFRSWFVRADPGSAYYDDDGFLLQIQQDRLRERADRVLAGDPNR